MQFGCARCLLNSLFNAANVSNKLYYLHKQQTRCQKKQNTGDYLGLAHGKTSYLSKFKNQGAPVSWKWVNKNTDDVICCPVLSHAQRGMHSELEIKMSYWCQMPSCTGRYWIKLRNKFFSGVCNLLCFCTVLHRQGYRTVCSDMSRCIGDLLLSEEKKCC